MGTSYVGTKTAQFYEEVTGRKTHPALIFGDEVETTGDVTNGRVPVKFRDLKGYVSEDNLQENPVLEIYFIDVGQGDSTFIVTPGRKKILIDGGVNRRALGFLAWKYGSSGNVCHSRRRFAVLKSVYSSFPQIRRILSLR
jgi:hypothetical protein